MNPSFFNARESPFVRKSLLPFIIKKNHILKSHINKIVYIITFT